MATPHLSTLSPLSPQETLLHRAPFLFVDHAQIDEDGLGARSERRFLADEAYFAGHFPGAPIVPGVLLIEMLAQTANVLLSQRRGAAVQGMLVGVEDAKFSHPVRPLDTVAARVRVGRETRVGDAARPGLITSFSGTVALGTTRCLRATVNIWQAIG